MGVDLDKYKKISSFASYNDDFERQMTIEQAIEEFDIYMQYSPNTHKIYVNDSTTPILGNFQDVSDLEVRADTKWLLTSVNNKINAGDIITWKNKKWICMYDKEKNTANCCKVKVQPCNYIIKIPMLDKSNTPMVYNADSIIMTFLTDTKDFKQPFPTESGTTFITVQFNEYTSVIQRQSRIWLYDGAFEVTGVDFTNIDFYLNKGFLKWTLRPSNNISDFDNVELGVCDYYKFYPKTTTTTTTTINKLNINYEKRVSFNSITKIDVLDSLGGQNVNFTFEGNSLGCELRDVTNTSCKLYTSNQIGIIYIKAELNSNPNVYSKLRIVIEN